MPDDTDTDALVARVRRAFAEVAYPGDAALTDSFGDEADALVAEFSGRTDWRTLDAEFLDQAPDGWGTALSFFSGAALRFYLPAYLVADLRGALNVADPAIRLSMLVAPQTGRRRLARHYGGGTLGEYARREFALFDVAEVGVIVDYLWWCLATRGADPTIEQGLEHYWLERLESLDGG